MRSSDLSARFACQDLMIESYRLVDEGKASDVTRLFTDDGEFLIEGIAAISGRDDPLSLIVANGLDVDATQLGGLSDALQISP